MHTYVLVASPLIGNNHMSYINTSEVVAGDGGTSNIITKIGISRGLAMGDDRYKSARHG